MLFLYWLSLRTYGLAVAIAAPFKPKAKLFFKGRLGWLSKMPKWKNERVAWFHCSSLGEFEQARPVIEGFAKQYPDFKIALTFFSPSGYEVRKHYPIAHWVGYLPLDSRVNAKNFLNRLNPEVAFFVKYDFWYFYLTELKNRSIPTLLFSATFRKDQLFFKKSATMWKVILRCFTMIFVQDEKSEELLNGIYIQRVMRAGDSRADRVMEIANTEVSYPIVEAFVENATVGVIGSAWEADTDVIVPVWRRNAPETKLIVAPHELHEEYIEILLEKCGGRGKAVRYSKATAAQAKEAHVLILDTMGMLSQIYRYGNWAYVGGGFGSGIHNTLEAAVYGIPVFFGPRFHKFNEARGLIKAGAAIPIDSVDSFQERLANVILDERKVKYMGTQARKYVEDNCGATDSILKYCKGLLRDTPDSFVPEVIQPEISFAEAPAPEVKSEIKAEATQVDEKAQSLLSQVLASMKPFQVDDLLVKESKPLISAEEPVVTPTESAQSSSAPIAIIPAIEAKITGNPDTTTAKAPEMPSFLLKEEGVSQEPFYETYFKDLLAKKKLEEQATAGDLIQAVLEPIEADSDEFMLDIHPDEVAEVLSNPEIVVDDTPESQFDLEIISNDDDELLTEIETSAEVSTETEQVIEIDEVQPEPEEDISGLSEHEVALHYYTSFVAEPSFRPSVFEEVLAEILPDEDAVELLAKKLQLDLDEIARKVASEMPLENEEVPIDMAPFEPENIPVPDVSFEWQAVQFDNQFDDSEEKPWENMAEPIVPKPLVYEVETKTVVSQVDSLLDMYLDISEPEIPVEVEEELIPEVTELPFLEISEAVEILEDLQIESVIEEIIDNNTVPIEEPIRVEELISTSKTIEETILESPAVTIESSEKAAVKPKRATAKPKASKEVTSKEVGQVAEPASPKKPRKPSVPKSKTT